MRSHYHHWFTTWITNTIQRNFLLAYIYIGIMFRCYFFHMIVSYVSKWLASARIHWVNTVFFVCSTLSLLRLSQQMFQNIIKKLCALTKWKEISTYWSNDKIKLSFVAANAVVRRKRGHEGMQRSFVEPTEIFNNLTYQKWVFARCKQFVQSNFDCKPAVSAASIHVTRIITCGLFTFAWNGNHERTPHRFIPIAYRWQPFGQHSNWDLTSFVQAIRYRQSNTVYRASNDWERFANNIIYIIGFLWYEPITFICLF